MRTNQNDTCEQCIEKTVDLKRTLNQELIDDATRQNFDNCMKVKPVDRLDCLMEIIDYNRINQFVLEHSEIEYCIWDNFCDEPSFNGTSVYIDGYKAYAKLLIGVITDVTNVNQGPKNKVPESKTCQVCKMLVKVLQKHVPFDKIQLFLDEAAESACKKMYKDKLDKLHDCTEFMLVFNRQVLKFLHEQDPKIICFLTRSCIWL